MAAFFGQDKYFFAISVFLCTDNIQFSVIGKQTSGIFKRIYQFTSFNSSSQLIPKCANQWVKNIPLISE